MQAIKQDLNTEQLVGHYKKHIASTYIGSHDFMKPDGTFADAVVEIDGVFKREIYNPGKKQHEDRLVASLKGKEKCFILNSTNCKAIEQISGQVMADKWVGAKIKLVVRKVKVGREQVDALRVEKP